MPNNDVNFPTKQPTTHPIHNAQARFFNPGTGKWDLGRQPMRADDLSLDTPIMNLLREIVIELKILNMQIANQGPSDDLDQMRADPSFFASA